MSLQVKELETLKQVWCQICDSQADQKAIFCKECLTIYCTKCTSDQFYCIDGCNNQEESFDQRFNQIDKQRIDLIKKAKLTCVNCNQQFKLDKIKNHNCKTSTSGTQSFSNEEKNRIVSFVKESEEEINKLKEELQYLKNTGGINKQQQAPYDKKAVQQAVDRHINDLISKKNLDVSQDGWLPSLVLPRQDLDAESRKLFPEFQQYKLLYRMTRDKSSNDNFHKNCDRFSNTITLIKANDSAIFGGFTTIAWKISEDKVFVYEPNVENENEQNQIQGRNQNEKMVDKSEMENQYAKFAFLPLKKERPRQGKKQQNASEKGVKSTLQQTQTFIFSITNGLKFQPKLVQLTNPAKAVGHWKGFGPCFGEEDLCIDLDCHINSKVQLGRSFMVENKNIEDQSTYLCLGSVWSIMELEVFMIAE